MALAAECAAITSCRCERWMAVMEQGSRSWQAQVSQVMSWRVCDFYFFGLSQPLTYEYIRFSILSYHLHEAFPSFLFYRLTLKYLEILETILPTTALRVNQSQTLYAVHQRRKHGKG